MLIITPVQNKGLALFLWFDSLSSMDEEDIEKLKAALKIGRVVWIFDNTTHEVIKIGFHAEEGDGIECAIFHDGYAVLYNADRRHFYTIHAIK